MRTVLGRMYLDGGGAGMEPSSTHCFQFRFNRGPSSPVLF